MLRSVLVAVGVVGVLAVPAVAQEPWPKLESSTVSPSTIESGRAAVQTITIDRPAPKGGIVVSSKGSSLYNSWRCCRSLRIPEGQRSISFPIREATTSATPVTYTHGVQVSGNGLKGGQAPLTVIPPDPAVQRVVAIHGPRAMLDGTSADVKVELLAPAPADDLVLSWWPNTTYGPTVSGSVWVRIPAGQKVGSESRSATLWGSDSPAVVTPSASLGASTVYWTTVLVPRKFAVGSTYVRPGEPALVGVGIGEAPNPDGTTVRLSTDVPGLELPATVTIPAGDPGASFEVKATSTPPDGTTGTITATWNGQSVTGQIYVGP